MVWEIETGTSNPEIAHGSDSISSSLSAAFYQRLGRKANELLMKRGHSSSPVWPWPLLLAAPAHRRPEAAEIGPTPDTYVDWMIGSRRCPTLSS